MKDVKKETKIDSTLIVGIVVVGLTLLGILASVIIPFAAESVRFKGMVKDILRGEYEYILLSDPLYESEDGDEGLGFEVRLTDAEIATLRASLKKVRAGGFDNETNEKKNSGAWDLQLQWRGKNGDLTTLYFTDRAAYYVKGNDVMLFSAEDEKAYAEYFALLEELIKTHAEASEECPSLPD
ncbi:MAG: hypothetical protein E7663_00300 [Ruminococcaceae bacterium]|nr:hypothetical protein [Oscillospiraceae bacterium]